MRLFCCCCCCCWCWCCWWWCVCCVRSRIGLSRPWPFPWPSQPSPEASLSRSGASLANQHPRAFQNKPDDWTWENRGKLKKNIGNKNIPRERGIKNSWTDIRKFNLKRALCIYNKNNKEKEKKTTSLLSYLPSAPLLIYSFSIEMNRIYEWTIAKVKVLNHWKQLTN